MGLYNVINRALMQSGQTEDISQVVANLDAIATILNGQIDPNNLRGAPNLQIQEAAVWTGVAFDRSTSTRLQPPSVGTGTPDATKYWRGDGAWTVFPTGVPNLSIGITLPASPIDTDEAILVDSLTTPTYAWRFKYVAGISDANKWIFLGGSSAESEVAATEGNTSLTYAALTTAGPSITVPRAGIYIVEIGAQVYQSGGGTASWMSYDIGGTAAVDADAIASYLNIPSGGYAAQSKAARKTIAAANTALVAKYRLNAATAGNNFGNRWMRVTPVRVA